MLVLSTLDFRTCPLDWSWLRWSTEPISAETLLGLQVHDIEDLKVAGKRKQGCPYFAARAMAETAELVFCPYNYIVDPIIRESVKVDLKVRLHATSSGCNRMKMSLANSSQRHAAEFQTCVCI